MEDLDPEEPSPEAEPAPLPPPLDLAKMSSKPEPPALDEPCAFEAAVRSYAPAPPFEEALPDPSPDPSPDAPMPDQSESFLPDLWSFGIDDPPSSAIEESPCWPDA